MLSAIRAVYAPRHYDPHTIRQIVEDLEAPVHLWNARLRRARHVKYMEIRYERLATARTATAEFQKALSFLGANALDARIIHGSEAEALRINLRVHPPLCEDRVNWSELRGHLNGTMTYEACEFLSSE